jgi:cytochrome c oxidase cbb3-type subunit 3
MIPWRPSRTFGKKSPRPSRKSAVKILFLVVVAGGSLLAQQRSDNSAAVAEGLRLYNSNCAACHGSDGDFVSGVDLRSGKFQRASTDSDLARIVSNGISGTAMPPTNFTAAQVTAVVAYLRSPRDTPVRSSSSGDAGRGLALFEGKGACLTCHRVHGKGSRLGPDLSDIGGSRPAPELERSILDPNATVLPQHRFVRAITRDGVTITGRRLNEDTLTVQLIDSNERLVSLNRADLREYTLLKTSPMPSYQGKLTSQELADLVSYLLSLKASNTP